MEQKIIEVIDIPDASEVKSLLFQVNINNFLEFGNMVRGVMDGGNYPTVKFELEEDEDDGLLYFKTILTYDNTVSSEELEIISSEMRTLHKNAYNLIKSYGN